MSWRVLFGLGLKKKKGPHLLQFLDPLGPFFGIGTKKRKKRKRSSESFEGSWRILFGLLLKKKSPHFFTISWPPWDHFFELRLKKKKKEKVLRNFWGELKNFVQFRLCFSTNWPTSSHYIYISIILFSFLVPIRKNGPRGSRNCKKVRTLFLF